MQTMTDEQAALTEAHRLACEARQVLAWPLDKRRDYLARVAEKRGADACEYLKAAIKQQWAKRREAA